MKKSLKVLSKFMAAYYLAFAILFWWAFLNLACLYYIGIFESFLYNKGLAGQHEQSNQLAVETLKARLLIWMYVRFVYSFKYMLVV